MGIVSGFLNIVKNAAGAFKPKQEPPPQEPMQIQIVDSRQKTHKEQVHDWIEGSGGEPEKIRRIRERARYDVLVEEGKEPSTALRIIETEGTQRISELKAERQAKVKRGKRVGKFIRKVLTGGPSRRVLRGTDIPHRDIQVAAMRSGKAAFPPTNFDLGFGDSKPKKKTTRYDLNFGKWKL